MYSDATKILLENYFKLLFIERAHPRVKFILNRCTLHNFIKHIFSLYLKLHGLAFERKSYWDRLQSTQRFVVIVGHADIAIE